MRKSERLYRRLLALALPPGFREEAEEELVEVFRDLRRRSRGRGGLARLGFWPRILMDLAWTAGLAWRESWRAEEMRSEADSSGRRTMTTRRGFFTSGLLGQALRGAYRRPGHALTVALTVGLGVGAGTLVTVIARDVLLAPPPLRARPPAGSR